MKHQILIVDIVEAIHFFTTQNSQIPNWEFCDEKFNNSLYFVKSNILDRGKAVFDIC